MFTKLEKDVFNMAVDFCIDASWVEAEELAESLSLPVNTVKGVVGSLTKKGLMYSNVETINFQKYNAIFPVVTIDGVEQGLSFGCDQDIDPADHYI